MFGYTGTHIDLTTILGIINGIVVLGYLIYYLVRHSYSLVRYYAKSVLGLKVTVFPEQLKRQETLMVYIEVNPKRKLILDVVEVVLRCERIYKERRDNYLSWGDSRNNVYTEKDDLARSTHFLGENEVLRPFQRKTYKCEILVPKDGLPTKTRRLGWSIGSQSISINWYLTVRFNLKGFPDAIVTKNIFVSR